MKLTVEKFSCIKNAEIEIASLNILIGPQASGKSVLSKLVYFFLDFQRVQVDSLVGEKSFDLFCADLKNSFIEMFPISAWGKEKFKISFSCDDFEIRISRGSYNESVKDNIRLGMSLAIKDFYKSSLELVRKTRSKSGRVDSKDHFARFDLSWQLTRQLSRLAGKKFEKCSPNSLTFIPAGRSFFTNLGKAFLAFDQGRLLDPINISFGRLYSSLIGDGHYPSRNNELQDELEEILGGELHRQGDRYTIRCEDGRDIPLAALSSGQQELLPLFLTFNYLNEFTRYNREKTPQITIIEEPEAHLFPTAQSKMVLALVAYVNASQARRQLILTTHSPYVLSKINNLLKAGELEKKISRSKLAELNDLVPSKRRLLSKNVRAYAIHEQTAISILDDGLIAADYLDAISNEIGDEFTELLRMEYGE